jgi:hypothetical protein
MNREFGWSILPHIIRDDGWGTFTPASLERGGGKAPQAHSNDQELCEI